MLEKQTENTDTTQVTPVPATPAPQVEKGVDVEKAPEAKPTDSPVESKTNAAFAAMRKAKRELEKQLAAAKAVVPPPATPVPAPEQPKPEPIPVAPAPVQVNTEGIEAESEKAIMELSADKELAKISGGVYEVVSLVDSDPRLMRLHAIDPKLAFKEAKDMFLSKAGVTAPPPIPKSNTPSGGTGIGANDLDTLYEETQRYPAGSREWHKAVKAFNEASKQAR